MNKLISNISNYCQSSDSQIIRSLPQISFPIIRKKSSYYLKHFAQRLKFIDGQTHYAKYIIICSTRTGSNMLRSLLNSHSRIVGFGELFQNNDKIGWYLPGYSQNRKLRAIYHDNPAEFLKRVVFCKYPRGIAAVGFKYLYEHTHGNSWKILRPFFKHATNLKIIHLKRRNILRSYLSQLTAQQTNRWVNCTDIQSAGSPLTLDFRNCLWHFRAIRAYEAYFDVFFKNHPTIEVSYEQLVSNRDIEMKRVLRFLGAGTEDLFPSIYRQSCQSLSIAISNYADLKNKFMGTEWEIFFEE